MKNCLHNRYTSNIGIKSTVFC